MSLHLGKRTIVAEIDEGEKWTTVAQIDFEIIREVSKLPRTSTHTTRGRTIIETIGYRQVTSGRYFFPHRA